MALVRKASRDALKLRNITLPSQAALQLQVGASIILSVLALATNQLPRLPAVLIEKLHYKWPAPDTDCVWHME